MRPQVAPSQRSSDGVEMVDNSSTRKDDALDSNGSGGDHGKSAPKSHTQEAKQAIQQRMDNVCNKSDMHGLPDWWKTLEDRKEQKLPLVMWTIVVCVAVIMAVWFLVLTIKDYISEPIVSSYNLRNERALVLPDVYICPPISVHKFKTVAASVPYLKLYDEPYSDYKMHAINYYANTIRQPSIDRAWKEAHFDDILEANIHNFTGLLGWLSTASDRDAGFLQPEAGAVPSYTGEQAPPFYAEEYIDPPAACELPQCPPRPAPYKVWTPATAEELYMKLSYSKESFVRECQIGTPDDGSGRWSCGQYVEEVFDSDYGKCFLVKLNKNNVKQTVPGRGVSIVLDLHYAQSTHDDTATHPGGGEVKCNVGELGRDGQQQLPSLPGELIERPTPPPPLSDDKDTGRSADNISDVARGTFIKGYDIPLGSIDLRTPVSMQVLSESPIAAPPDSACDTTMSRRKQDGVVVRIGAPYDAAEKAAFVAEPNQRTFALLSLTKMKMVERKNIFTSRLCVADAYGKELLDMFSNDVDYSVGLCRMQCSLRDAWSRCGCLRPIDKTLLSDKYKDAAFCSVQQMRECAVNVRELDKVATALSDCAADCLTPCEYNSIRMSLSSTKFYGPSGPLPTTTSIADETSDDEPLDESMLNKTLAELGFTEQQLVPTDGDIQNYLLNMAERQLPPSIEAAASRMQLPCWAPWIKHDTVDYAACPTKFETYKRDVDRTLKEMNISTKKQYREHFEWMHMPLAEPNGDDYATRARDVVVLEIAYEDLQYTEAEQGLKITFTSCIGTMGGHFGLWLGASIISIVKVILFCVTRFN